MLRGDIVLGSRAPLATALSSTSQYNVLFYVCFCLKTPCLIYTVGSFTQKCYKPSTKQTAEMTLVYSVRADPRGRSIASEHLSQEHARWAARGFPAQLMSANDQIILQTLTWGLKVTSSEWVDSQIRNLHINEAGFCYENSETTL